MLYPEAINQVRKIVDKAIYFERNDRLGILNIEDKKIMNPLGDDPFLLSVLHKPERTI
jgi:hypothetical protein